MAIRNGDQRRGEVAMWEKGKINDEGRGEEVRPGSESLKREKI